MADFSDVSTALVATINAFVLSYPARIYPGWPDPSLLQSDMKASFSNVSVWPLPTEKVSSITMGVMDWSEDTNNGVTGIGSREDRRQTRQYQISTWSSTPQERDALGAQIDSGLAALTRIILPDYSTGVLSYVSSRNIDDRQTVAIYRRDVVYSVNFPIIQTQALTAVKAPVINVVRSTLVGSIGSDVGSTAKQVMLAALPSVLAGVATASASASASLSESEPLSGAATAATSASGILSNGNAVVPAAKVPIGANMRIFSWYSGMRSFNNCALYFPWTSATNGTLCNPAHITPGGELLSLPAGGSAYIFMGPVLSTGIVRRRVEWTGAGNTGQIYSHNQSTGILNGSLTTSGIDSTVSPAVNWIEYTQTISTLVPPASGSGNDQFEFTAVNPADPPRNVFCSEVNGTTPNGGTRVPFFYDRTHRFHPTFLTLISTFDELRFMDWSNVNNTYNPATPVTATNRAQITNAYPANHGTSVGALTESVSGVNGAFASLSDGTSTRLVAYPGGGGRTAQLAFWEARLAAGANPVAWNPGGAAANEITFIIEPASGSGSIIVDPIALTATITPSVSSVTLTTANQLASLFVNGSATTLSTGTYPGNSSVGIVYQLVTYVIANPNGLVACLVSGFDNRYYVTGTGLEIIAPGIYPMSGGFDPQAYGLVGIEDQVYLANYANADLHTNIPPFADNSFIQLYGQYVAANLNANLQAKFEIGNEPWNYGFGATATLATLAQLYNTYGMTSYTFNESTLSEGYILQLLANAKTVMTPYAAQRTLGFEYVFNNTQGGINNNLGGTFLAINDTQSAPVFAATVDYMMTAPYTNIALGFYTTANWRTGAFTAPAVVQYRNTALNTYTVYICTASYVSTGLTPDLDTAHWVQATSAPALLAGLMKQAIDATMAQVKIDHDYTVNVLGKKYKTYECGYGYDGSSTGIDPAFLAFFANDPVYAYKLMNYMISQYFAATGNDPDAVFNHYGLVAGISSNIWLLKQYNTDSSALWQVVLDQTAGTPHPYFLDSMVPCVVAGAYVGPTLSATLGTATSIPLAVAGGVAPYTFALSGAPAGVTYNGGPQAFATTTATAAGTTTGMELTVTDANGNTDTFGPFSLLVA